MGKDGVKFVEIQKAEVPRGLSCVLVGPDGNVMEREGLGNSAKCEARRYGFFSGSGQEGSGRTLASKKGRFF